MPRNWIRINPRYGLRALLLAMTALAVVCAYATHRWRQAVRQEKFVREILAAHGRVQYDDGWDPSEITCSAITDQGCVLFRQMDEISPSVMRQRNLCHHVVAVELGQVHSEGEDYLELIGEFSRYPKIRRVRLRGPGVSAKEIAQLAALRHLDELRLDDVPIGDAAFDSLRRLAALKSLILSRDRVGSLNANSPPIAEVAAALRRALPQVNVTIDDSVNAPP